MGDRIAILRGGRRLSRSTATDATLAHPADDFVAKFIGEDRAPRRLALRRCQVRSNCRYQVPRSQYPIPGHVRHHRSRNAVSLMLELKTDELAVKEGNRIVGVFHLRDVNRLL
jgi:osmoprotectant transport system ATP-binding protein